MIKTLVNGKEVLAEEDDYLVSLFSFKYGIIEFCLDSELNRVDKDEVNACEDAMQFVQDTIQREEDPTLTYNDWMKMHKETCKMCQSEWWDTKRKEKHPDDVVDNMVAEM